MKRVYFVFAVIILMVLSACSSISSLPSSMIVYYEPVLANQTAVFVGSGLEYATARNAAIKKVLDEGYTKIVTETIGMNSVSGLVNVTLVVIK